MIEFPLWVLAAIYLAGVLVFFGMCFFQLYHLVRFGFFDAEGKFYTAFFVIFTVLIIGLTLVALINVDWFQTVSLFGNTGSQFDSSPF